MSHIYKPREIIDRRKIHAVLDALAAESISEEAKRIELLSVMKEAFKVGNEIIRERFEHGGYSGVDAVAAHSYLMDQIIRIIFDYAIVYSVRRGVPTTGERISIVAIGGYGRGELAPHSDIDLLFLLPYKKTPLTEQLVEFMLYLLWDMKLKVGHAVRSVGDNISQAKEDMTIRTTLLEARWVWGDQELAAELMSRFDKEVKHGTAKEFVQAKLAERDQRHENLGDSRYRLEPNVKEDKGGLRDLHTLYWIAKYLYGVSDIRKLEAMGVLDDDAATRFVKAREFLSTVRCHIHYTTGRPDNRLTFDLQRTIAPRLGYVDRPGATAVERFMKHYFLVVRDVGDLTRIFCTLLEEQGRGTPKFRLPVALRTRSVDGFPVEGGRISVLSEEVFEVDPIKLLSIFQVALKHSRDFHPLTLRYITSSARRVAELRKNSEANRIFLEILISEKGSEAILRLMSECGVFGRFIPDFARVVAQMQYDMYHVYTTDEHTIRAIGILNSIEQGRLKDELPIASEVVGKIQSRRALYVATLLHDIAKGRGGDHSSLGAEIADELCPRLGLTDEETETTSWLVRSHLFMSATAFKRDLDDPQTITQFCEAVQSPERLKLLLVLTCADIRAVGPNVWNNWKATLLRELYMRADQLMRGGHAAGGTDARVTAARKALAARLSDWPKDVLESYIDFGPPAFWLTFGIAMQEHYARFMLAADEDNEKLAFDFTVDEERGATHMVIYTQDYPGLFADIARALTLTGVSVVDAKILTFSNSMAVDTFTIQDQQGQAVKSESWISRIESRVTAILEGQLRFKSELPKVTSHLLERARALEVPPRVIIDNTASKMCSVIEVNGHDRPGFLADVTKAMTGLGLQIFSAHISTYGERVVDVFYVKDIFGMRVEHETKIRQIREALGEAIGVKADAVSVRRKPMITTKQTPKEATIQASRQAIR